MCGMGVGTAPLVALVMVVVVENTGVWVVVVVENTGVWGVVENARVLVVDMVVENTRQWSMTVHHSRQHCQLCRRM